MKSIYSYCYLASEVSFYEGDFKTIPENLLNAMDKETPIMRSIGRILGLVEEEDFMKGFPRHPYKWNCP